MSVIVDSRRREDIEEEEKRKKAGIHTLVESDWGDFPGGPVDKTPQCREAWIQSLVRELDSTCHN